MYSIWWCITLLIVSRFGLKACAKCLNCKLMLQWNCLNFSRIYLEQRLSETCKISSLTSLSTALQQKEYTSPIATNHHCACVRSPRCQKLLLLSVGADLQGLVSEVGLSHTLRTVLMTIVAVVAVDKKRRTITTQRWRDEMSFPASTMTSW